MPIGPFRTYTQPVNVRDLERFEAGDEVTPETLKAKGLIRSIRKDVKLLGVGELTKKLTITVHGASATAREKVEAAGGTLTLLKEPKVRKAEEARSAAPAGRGAEDDEPEAEAEAAPRRGRRRGRERGLGPALLARQRVARPGAPAPGALHRRSSSRCTASARGCRRRASTRRTIENYFSGQGGIVLGLLNLFSGSALSRFSLFALGIMPYVTASIILQLLTVVDPDARAAAEGGRGRLRQDQPVHALPHRRPRGRAGAGYAYLFKRQGALQRRTPAASC